MAFLFVVIHEYSVHRSVATVVGLTVLGVLVAVAILGTVGVATESVAAQPTNETNATQHENPETVGERGDSDRLRNWLSGRLTDRLRENSIRVSQGQYERADDVFGEGFEQRLGQYVDVAGETDEDSGSDTEGDEDSGSDTEDQTAFERAQNGQSRFTALRQEYDDTYTAYRESRARGDPAAARQQARRLRQLEREIRQVGGSVTLSLRSIENGTGENTSDIRRRVQRVVQNVTELQDEVRAETFVETELTASTNRTVASFVDPVDVRGRLVTANDTAVADRSVRIRVGQRTMETTTGPNGTFSVTYRPILVRVDTATVPVRYQPDPTSQYLGTTTNVTLAVEQVDPSLELATTPDSARFGEAFTVEAVLSVDGRAVPGVPMGVTLSGGALGETATDSDGTAQLSGTVPAGIPPSSAPVDAVVVPENRAIGPVNASTGLVIRGSPTDLSASARITSAGVVVDGELVALSADGDTTAVPSQPVVVTVGNVTRTVRTDDGGQYEATVPVTAVTGSEVVEPVPVRARFDGSRTNLESARAETRLNESDLAGAVGQTGQTADGNSGGPTGEFLAWTRGDLVTVLLFGGGVLAWRWRRRDGDDQKPVADESVPPTEEPPKSTESPDRSPLADARDALSTGASDRAVIAAYTAVRAALTDRFDVGQSQTPREFLAACDQRLDPETHAALRTLTELYEQTVFAPEAIDAASQEAVDAAQSLLDTTPAQRGEVGDD